ncbi:MAG: 3-deoxy-D-manno-octulosonic acid transferase [Deltaproteobacteria bacterium]|nr:3-deoxy-D-manno-octulosonic acid transferase [Deltaproteobacteria bacterium]
MYLLYNLLLAALFPLLFPFFLWYLLRRQGSLDGLGERLGWGWRKKGGRRLRANCRLIWLHGASVGEVQMLEPLIRAWQKRHSRDDFLLTTMTLTGRRTAQRLFPELVVILMPLDLPFLWSRFWRCFQPSCLIFAETELWPNLLHRVRRSGVRLALVNARLSENSFRKYRRFGFFTRAMFQTPSLFVVQDRISGQRFLELGAAAARVVLSGNLKFDISPDSGFHAEFNQKRIFGREVALVVAGSTHPGEEDLILNAWEACCVRKGEENQVPSSCLVLAPRHPQRFAAVAELLQIRKLNFLRFSEFREGRAEVLLPRVPSVLLLDTLGDLKTFYSLARFAVIGGTLVRGVGGHNPLEAAVYAKAVVHGMEVANFRDGFNFLDEQGGGLPVRNGADLMALFERLLSVPELAEREGERAAATLERHRGALRRTLACLDELCGKPAEQNQDNV